MPSNLKYTNMEAEYIHSRINANWSFDLIAKSFKHDNAKHWANKTFTTRQVQYIKNSYKLPPGATYTYTGPKPIFSEDGSEILGYEVAEVADAPANKPANKGYTNEPATAGPSSAPMPVDNQNQQYNGMHNMVAPDQPGMLMYQYDVVPGQHEHGMVTPAPDVPGDIALFAGPSNAFARAGSQLQAAQDPQQQQQMPQWAHQGYSAGVLGSTGGLAHCDAADAQYGSCRAAHLHDGDIDPALLDPQHRILQPGKGKGKSYDAGEHDQDFKTQPHGVQKYEAQQDPATQYADQPHHAQQYHAQQQYEAQAQAQPHAAFLQAHAAFLREHSAQLQAALVAQQRALAAADDDAAAAAATPGHAPLDCTAEYLVDRDARGWWYDGPHDLWCGIAGKHRHEYEGGICFPDRHAYDTSMCALLEGVLGPHGLHFDARTGQVEPLDEGCGI